MTCIAGLVHEDCIYLGGDSATSVGTSVTIKANTKVFSNGPFVIGVAGAPRVGQLLRFTFTPPAPDTADDSVEELDPYEFMVTTFINAVRATLKEGGFLRRELEQEFIGGSSLLVGYHGALYRVDSNFGITMAQDDFDAIGSGAQAARGALHASQGKDPLTRMRLALEAADHFTVSVRCPFTILRLRTYRANPRLEAVECYEIECDFGETEQPQAGEDGAPSSPAA
jgi:ATP-dependent protease HslVU (ClpYQ) peptidase subunit